MTERIDDLMHTGLHIIQNNEYFGFGIDAILLSRFVNVHKGDKIIDLGTGNGVIPLMLTTCQSNIEIKAIEIQPQVADMARRSVELNNLTDIIEVITGDLNQAHDFFECEYFDIVTCNPPYLPVGEGPASRLNAHAAARHEVYCNINDVVKIAKSLVRYGGRVNIVYRATRLAELITLLRNNNLEPKRLQLVQSNNKKEAHIFLVEAIKGAKTGLRILPTLMIYDDNEYSADMKKACFPEG